MFSDEVEDIRKTCPCLHDGFVYVFGHIALDDILFLLDSVETQTRMIYIRNVGNKFVLDEIVCVQDNL